MKVSHKNVRESPKQTSKRTHAPLFLKICAYFDKVSLCQMDAVGFATYTLQRKLGAWRQFGERLEMGRSTCQGGFMQQRFRQN